MDNTIDDATALKRLGLTIGSLIALSALLLVAVNFIA